MTFNADILGRGLLVSPLCVQRSAPHRPRAMMRFFSAFNRALNTAGFLMAHRDGFCLVMPQADQTVQHARHAALSWLSSQPDVVSVILVDPMPIQHLLDGHDVWTGLADDLIEEFDEVDSHDAESRKDLLVSHSVYLGQRLAQGLLLQAARRWQADQALTRWRLALEHASALHPGGRHASR